VPGLAAFIQNLLNRDDPIRPRVDERPLRSAERSLQHCATLLTGNSFFQDSLM